MARAPVDTPQFAVARQTMTDARAAHSRLLESVADLDATAAAGDHGYRSTARLLEHLWRIDPAHAKRLVAQARDLVATTTLTGHPLAPRLPHTARALADGDIDDAHVRVITKTVRYLENVPGLEPHLIAEAENVLVTHASTLAPAGLARIAARIVVALDPDGALPDDTAVPDGEIHLRRRRDGVLVIAGLMSGADAEIVLEAFDALSTLAGPDDPRSLGRRRSDALADLAAQALSPTGIAAPEDDSPHDPTFDDTASAGDGPDDPTFDNLTGERGDDDRGDDAGVPDDPAAASRPRDTGRARMQVAGRALLSITIDQQWLREQVGHGLLDSGQAISPAEARRLACDAGIVPIVLGTRSEPLDIGRLSYTIPEGMRRALHQRDGGCSFPGCTPMSLS